jgi:hypothetical protein
MEVFVDYRIESFESGLFTLKFTASLLHEGQSADIYLDGEWVGKIEFSSPEYSLSKFLAFESSPFEIAEGIHELRFFFRGANTLDTLHAKRIEFIKTN